MTTTTSATAALVTDQLVDLLNEARRELWQFERTYGYTADEGRVLALASVARDAIADLLISASTRLDVTLTDKQLHEDAFPAEEPDVAECAECAECGHLHYLGGIEYVPCPIEGCGCPGRGPVSRMILSQGVRKQRERGISVYIPAEQLVKAGVDLNGPPPLYRTWGSARGSVLVRLYNKVEP